jgi:predicted dehydrogenase
MIRLGVIGCGKIAEKHLQAYKKLPDIEVTVTDIVPKGETIAQNYGVGWHGNPDELISEGSVDAVDICVPTPSHASFIIRALESGKHVFCEKPLARTVQEAKEIEAKVTETGRVAMVGYLYKFHPAYQFAKEIIEERIIGDPYYAIFRLGGRGSHKAWKHKRDTGGGAANEMLVHMLDIVLWYFGAVRSVRNLYTDTLLAERAVEGKSVSADAEDVIVLKIESTSGVQTICESDLVTPSYMNYVEIQGTNGSLWTSILDTFPTIVYCKQPRGVYDLGHNSFSFPKVDLFERELSYFLECVRKGEVPEVNSIRHSVEVMELAHSALLLGQTS